MAARRRNRPVAAIAEELEITPAYVYQLLGKGKADATANLLHCVCDAVVCGQIDFDRLNALERAFRLLEVKAINAVAIQQAGSDCLTEEPVGAGDENTRTTYLRHIGIVAKLLALSDVIVGDENFYGDRVTSIIDHLSLLHHKSSAELNIVYLEVDGPILQIRR